MSDCDFQGALSDRIKKEKLARRILGVSAGDGPEKIKKAFWLLAMKYHPDKMPGDRESERRFQNIVNAYDYLIKGRRAGVMLEEQDGKPPPSAGGYRIENAWGYYLWWRDNYFDERYGVHPGGGGEAARADAFERVDPHTYEEWYRSPRGAAIDAEEKSSLARLLGPGNGARLLDVGCGTGHFTRWFAEQGYQAFGIDTSLRFIGYAKPRSGALFTIAAGSDLPFAGNAFHDAVAIAVMEFARFPENIIREMGRVADRTLLLLMLNPDSDLNAKRRQRGSGIFASARFWEPDAAVKLLMDIFPDKAHRSIHREIHADFYVVILRGWKEHG